MAMFKQLLERGEMRPGPSENMLEMWRERVFFTIFFTSLIAAFVPYLLNMKIAIDSGLITNGITYTLAYLIALLVTFVKSIPFKLRAWIGLLLFYDISVLSLGTYGPVFVGKIWLFMFAVLATLILGLKAGVIALTLSTLTIIAWLWAWSNDYFFWSTTLQVTKYQIVATGFSFFFLNTVVTISAGLLVRVLENAFAKEKNLSNDLRLSNEKLTQENEERERTQKALMESEQKYRLLADNVNDMIWMMDIAQQQITYISPSVEKIQGFAPEEIVKRSLDAFLTPDSFERIQNTLREEITEDQQRDPERAVTLELEQYRKDGSTFWTEITASFIRDEGNRPTAVLGVTRDITERKAAEALMREKQTKLARAKKMESMGLMAGGIAHDLNNILSGIVSYPDLLLMDLPDDSPLRKRIQVIKESGERAAAVVADLLTVARGVATSKEIVNVNTLVEEYMASPEHERIATANPGIHFKTKLESELLNIRCSKTHLNMSLINLMLNASEAIGNAGTVTITTRNHYLDEPLKGHEDICAGEYVLLKVSDNGSGISLNHLDRIFEPFYTKKVMGRSGTGLGLSVVWNTVQDHKGYINVKSGDEGTEFELYFPATREPVDSLQGQVQLDDYHGHGEKILVVDDEENQRTIAREILTWLGYRYEQIIKIHPQQRAIIASGYTETEEIKCAQEMGAGEFIKKPYTLFNLGLCVKEELRKARSVSGQSKGMPGPNHAGGSKYPSKRIVSK